MKYLLLFFFVSSLVIGQSKRTEKRVLIFSKNSLWAYRHASIEAACASLKNHCKEAGIQADVSEDATLFTDTTLARYSALVFLSANQDIFDADQEAALQRYIRAGGGFVGIHSTTGVERNWKWFNRMLGATFQWHPPQQSAIVKIIDKTHPATKGLPTEWKRWDEWYFYGPITNPIKVLAVLDSTTFKSGRHTQHYPFAWYQDFEGGRVFYTAGGHNAEDFIEPNFVKHLMGGIAYAIGKNTKLDYTQLKKFERPPVKIITLDPGHFHAALVQKTTLPDVSPRVKVYAPSGADLQQHLARINAYNTREENPTKWTEEVYEGDDFFEKMITEKAGDVVVMAGNNAKKTTSILKAVEAGRHVLADKPMCIDGAGFEQLKKAFEVARKNDVLLYDIMTERSEITTDIQRELSKISTIFGVLEKGTQQKPAIVEESVHHFYKFVSGAPLIRPQWFMDTQQQGEGIVDVTTHLVDLVHWAAFPDTPLSLKDGVVLDAKRWPTEMSLSQFSAITGAKAFPTFLKKNLKDEQTLQVFANGEIDFKLKDIHAQVRVLWNYSAEKGGDTHYSLMRGTKASLEVRQGVSENYIPQLYIIPADLPEPELRSAFSDFAKKYPGIGLIKVGEVFRVDIPASYRTGHEAHFGEVMSRFLKYQKVNNMPDWEVPNMLLKYQITTQALELAKTK
jgi:type 1 glutamine amidotransferase/predicted dehydrogenase